MTDVPRNPRVPGMTDEQRNRYAELSILRQVAISRLINTIAACKGLLEEERTVTDINMLAENLQDRSRLAMYQCEDVHLLDAE